MKREEEKQHERTTKRKGRLKVPKINVGGLPIPRSDGVNSLTSNVSAASGKSRKSTYSNALDCEMAHCRKDRQEIKTLHKKEEAFLSRMEAKLQKIQSACKVQMNVNQTVKDGISSLQGWLQEMKKQHEEADRKEEWFVSSLFDTEMRHNDRKKVRWRLQQQMLKDVIIGAAMAKRQDSPTESPEKKRAKKPGAGKKKEETKEKNRKMEEKKGRAQQVLVKIVEGKSYASVLGKIRKEANPDAYNTTILSVRSTGKGHILLKIGRDSDKEAFGAELRKTVNGMSGSYGGESHSKSGI